MKLKNKVAIITGAAKGIGKGCALVFADEGAKVVIVDIDEKSGKQTETEIIQRNGVAKFIKTDLTSSAEVQAMINSVVDTFGQIDIMFNNAGYHISKNVEITSEEEWDYIINTNLKSVFMCCKYTIPHLRKTKGCIINMSSMVGLIGQSNAGAYSATKGGIVAMTKGMSLDFAKDDIRVNCICPGWVHTPLVEDWFGQQADPEKARQYIYSVHPLNRIATSEEIGNAAAFLASSEASFITGVALPVDGAVSLGY
jgi:NAD(P)-dependent dehydrogenase (short-subunit alcohol dehydrogenase family)